MLKRPTITLTLIASMLAHMKASTTVADHWRRLPRRMWWLAAGLIIATVLATKTAAQAQPKPATTSVKSVSVETENGESITIRKSATQATPILKGELYAELQQRTLNNKKQIRYYEDCKPAMDSYYCWKMFGESIDKKPPKIPGSLLQLAPTPIYTVITYKPIFTDLNGQKKIGDEGLVVCLNPLVPEGYWKVIDHYKPILKYTPKSETDPLEVLKSKACKAFASFR